VATERWRKRAVQRRLGEIRQRATHSSGQTAPWRDEGGVEALGQGKIAREMEDSEGVVVVSTDVI
jgi:hypothetical protein